MKLKLHLFVLMVVGATSGSLWAQYGFGTNNPNASAAMEIVSPDKGVLIPKISLTASMTFTPITGTASSSHHGMLVFNTNTATETTPGVSNGLYGTAVYYWHHEPGLGTNNGSWRQVGGQELDGEFVQSGQVTTSIVTLTLSGDPTPVVLDVSALEEMQHGDTNGKSPTTSTTFTVSPTEGTLYYDTASSTLWGYMQEPPGSGTLVWKRVEGLNLYNTDGTLLSSRTVTFDNNDLTFETGTGSFTIRTSATETPTFAVTGGVEGRVYAGTGSYTGMASYTASLQGSPTNLDLVVDGDVKIGRYIVDENDSVGKDGQVLSRTATGMEWRPGNILKVQTFAGTGTTSPALDTGLFLISPTGGNVTAELPAIGTGADQFPNGYVLKIRRNNAYSATNTHTLTIDPDGAQTIGGAETRSLNMGYQSLTLVAAGTDWAIVD